MNSSNARSDLASAHRRIWPDLAIPAPSMPSESLRSASRCQHSLEPLQGLTGPLRASLSAFGGSSPFGRQPISKVQPGRILHRRIWSDLAIPEPSRGPERLLTASRCQHSLEAFRSLSEPLRASLSAFGGSSTFAWSSISKVQPGRILHRRICPDLTIPEPSRGPERLQSASRCQDSYKPLQRLTEPLRTPLRASAIDRGSNTNTTLDIYLTTL